MKSRKQLRRELVETSKPRKADCRPKKDDRPLPKVEKMRRHYCWRENMVNYKRFEKLIASFIGWNAELAFSKIRKMIGNLYDERFSYYRSQLLEGCGWYLFFVDAEGKIQAHQKKRYRRNTREVYLKSLSKKVPTKEVRENIFLLDDGIHYFATYEELNYTQLILKGVVIKDLLKKKCPIYPSELLLESPSMKYRNKSTSGHDTSGFYVRSIRHLTKKELKTFGLKNKEDENSEIL